MTFSTSREPCLFQFPLCPKHFLDNVFKKRPEGLTYCFKTLIKTLLKQTLLT